MRCIRCLFFPIRSSRPDRLAGASDCHIVNNKLDIFQPVRVGKSVQKGPIVGTVCGSTNKFVCIAADRNFIPDHCQRNRIYAGPAIAVRILGNCIQSPIDRRGTQCTVRRSLSPFLFFEAHLAFATRSCTSTFYVSLGGFAIQFNRPPKISPRFCMTGIHNNRTISFNVALLVVVVYTSDNQFVFASSGTVGFMANAPTSSAFPKRPSIFAKHCNRNGSRDKHHECNRQGTKGKSEILVIGSFENAQFQKFSSIFNQE